MAWLFVDTTYDIQVGLLGGDLEWLELRSQLGQKTSAILHQEVHDLCRAHGLRPLQLKGLVTLAGPGFYTGLRLSEGFGDVFRAFSLPCYSFYSHEIPRMLGHEKGTWVTKAYRGEYFFQDWDGPETIGSLVAAKDFEAQAGIRSNFFIHSPRAIDRELSFQTSTLELLRQAPSKVFGRVIKEKILRESFYFRAPEDEFRVSQ